MSTTRSSFEPSEDAWGDAFGIAVKETGLEEIPETCPWSTEQILDSDWLLNRPRATPPDYANHTASHPRQRLAAAVAKPPADDCHSP